MARPPQRLGSSEGARSVCGPQSLKEEFVLISLKLWVPGGALGHSLSVGLCAHGDTGSGGWC